MIEKVTLQLSGDADFTSEGGPRCEEMNPKTLLLYAAAKCVGKTALMIMDKERFRPKRFEIGISGELSDELPQSESTFKSFHVVYNIECDTEDDQAKVSRAVTLAHEKYCGMMQMLRKMQLQTVLITTVEKASAIQPYCDITYSIVRHGDVNAIAPFYRLNASEEIGS